MQPFCYLQLSQMKYILKILSLAVHVTIKKNFQLALNALLYYFVKFDCSKLGLPLNFHSHRQNYLLF